MSRVAFTGTRKGMTLKQATALRALLQPFDSMAHGDCVGADAEAYAIARSVGCQIICRPCTLSAQRAWCGGDINFTVVPPLQRNRDLVDSSELVIAAPAQLCEVLRSGTWATIRYARKRGVPVIILAP